MSADFLVYQMSPAAVILDFDGVVVDSLSAHLAAWSEAVQAVFKRPLGNPETIARHSTRVIAQILAQRFGDSSLASTLANVKERLLADGTVPVPLLGNALAFLDAASAAGVPLGVASNSRGVYVRALLERYGLASRLAAVVCGDEVRFPKPHPDIFWECANRMQVAPAQRSRVLVFEDSLHGIDAARAAGMTPVGIASLETEDELRRRGAVAAFAELGAAVGVFAAVT
jgi:HAD superfamily hydrolase (TIGR01509 family)